MLLLRVPTAVTVLALPYTYNINGAWSAPMDKLDYVYWKSTFLSVLSTHELEHIVLEPEEPKLPPDGTPNPKFKQWDRASKLILTFTSRAPITYTRSL